MYVMHKCKKTAAVITVYTITKDRCYSHDGSGKAIVTQDSIFLVFSERERELTFAFAFAICRRPSVCLSVVCL